MGLINFITIKILYLNKDVIILNTNYTELTYVFYLNNKLMEHVKSNYINIGKRDIHVLLAILVSYYYYISAGMKFESLIKIMMKISGLVENRKESH